ncbi:DUF397 domain-containing protein [Saccharopolyspora indica]|uniref:DUF397 domain-containing protein n=1 Tax=Saccharopolyspora indica TaxID=1229659 RepID=UPI002FDBB24F
MFPSQPVDGWITSSHSHAGTCVQVRGVDGGAAVRDSKNQGGGYFVADRAQWSAFMAAVKADRFGG